MANSYRINAAEFLFFARRTGLTILPRWLSAHDKDEAEEAVIQSLLMKDFLLVQGEEVLPHPLMAYLFMIMNKTEVWLIFGEEAFLYLSEQTPVLLEKTQTLSGQMRIIPFEHRQSCWDYLRECPYFPLAAAAYGDEQPEKAKTIISEMEKYLEQ